jgi:hypothetical protein
VSCHFKRIYPRSQCAAWTAVQRPYNDRAVNFSIALFAKLFDSARVCLPASRGGARLKLWRTSRNILSTLCQRGL